MSSNQIILQLGIGDGDVQPIPFDNKTDLLDYVKENIKSKIFNPADYASIILAILR